MGSTPFSAHRGLPPQALFEDQIGARPWLRDAGPRRGGPAVYTEHWVNRTAEAHRRGMVIWTEQGFDLLAATESAFCGSVLETYAEGASGPWWINSSYAFPMSAMVFRHSVLINQHNLAPETFVYSLATLTFNMAHGYQLAVSPPLPALKRSF